MIPAVAALTILLVFVFTESGVRIRPFDRKDMERVQRLSERLRREGFWPYD